MNKKKYIIGLVFIILIVLAYYIYSINNIDFEERRYMYWGNTRTVNIENHDKELASDNDWEVTYIVEPISGNNETDEINFDDNDKYEGQVNLKYNGSNKDIINEITEISVYIDGGYVGIPSITGKYDSETSNIVNDENEIVSIYVDESFTPKCKTVFDVEVKLKLIDGTYINYWSIISVGPQNIFNIEYMKKLLKL